MSVPRCAGTDWNVVGPIRALQRYFDSLQLRENVIGQVEARQIDSYNPRRLIRHGRRLAMA